MLEIGIIISLALILILILKNFPKTKKIADHSFEPSVVTTGINPIPKANFLSKIFQKKNEGLSDIKEAIDKDSDKIIAPVEISEAQRAYREKNPEVAKILYESDVAYERGDLREAEELALSALGEDKKCAKAYVVIGKVAYSRGSFFEAEEAFKTALKCDKELGEAYFGLGQIKLRDENYSQALDNLQRAVNLDRGVALWYAELGKAYMQVRQFSKAAKALKRASSLEIDNKEYRDLASEAEDKQRAHSAVYRFKK